MLVPVNRQIEGMDKCVLYCGNFGAISSVG